MAGGGGKQKRSRCDAKLEKIKIKNILLFVHTACVHRYVSG